MLSHNHTMAYVLKDHGIHALPSHGQPKWHLHQNSVFSNTDTMEKSSPEVVLLNVWATWCPSCVEEMPTLQRLYDRLYARGLEILAISTDALGAQVVRPFMQTHGWTFPVLLDTQGRVVRLYHTLGIPETFLVDKRGLRVRKVVGPRDGAHPQMIALFERLLAAPSSSFHSQDTSRQRAVAGSRTDDPRMSPDGSDGDAMVGVGPA